jgi:hypothetical protein
MALTDDDIARLAERLADALERRGMVRPHDQRVPAAGEGKETNVCRDQRTNAPESSGRIGTRVARNGDSSRSTRRAPLGRKIDRALSIIQLKMKRSKQSDS